MTETPDPTRELDMSEVEADTETESELREEDIEDRAPDDGADAEAPIVRPGPAPDGRIAGEPGGRV